MRRALAFGLAMLALGIFNQPALAGEATPEQWEKFAEDLAEFQATFAQAEAMVTRGPGQNWRWDECRFQSLDRAIWTDREERLTAQCATAKWHGVSLATLSRIVTCESGWNRMAYNPGGTYVGLAQMAYNPGGPYVGLAQHALAAWPGRVHAYGPSRWDHPLSMRWQNSRSAIVVTVRMMNAVGLGPWACA